MSVISIIAYPILTIKRYIETLPNPTHHILPLRTLVPTKFLDSRCGKLHKYALNLALSR